MLKRNFRYEQNWFSEPDFSQKVVKTISIASKIVFFYKFSFKIQIYYFSLTTKILNFCIRCTSTLWRRRCSACSTRTIIMVGAKLKNTNIDLGRQNDRNFTISNAIASQIEEIFVFFSQIMPKNCFRFHQFHRSQKSLG